MDAAPAAPLPLTHLAEAGVNLPLLMAKSGHENLRSLKKYARPSAEAEWRFIAAGHNLLKLWQASRPAVAA